MRFWFAAWMSCALLSVGACGGDNDDSEGDEPKEDAGPEDAGNGQSPEPDGGTEDAGDAGAVDAGGPDAESDPEAGTEVEPFCPDGKLQKDRGEVCDDGNFFDDDGCTRLCELTCENDLDCEDDNPCDGDDVCNAQHFCENGPDPETGTKCGDTRSCFYGECLPDSCGDQLVNEEFLGEECDDGNTDDDDGCTTECEFTCTSNSDCEGGDPCAGTRTCNIETHMCGADPLDDEAPCSTDEVPDGWCVDGVCVPTDCGNGEVEGNEQCDLGEDNGKPGSECSKACRWVICGNGTVEGEEDCDDGGNTNLDGCDENCKAEVFMRWTRQQLLRSPAPEWCVHAGKNQFANAIPPAVPVPFSPEPVDVLDDVNAGLIEGFDECTTNPIIQLLGLEDTTFTTSDDEVELAEYSGRLADGETCQNPMPVDAEFVITDDDLGPDNRRTETVPMIQRPGAIRTKSPIDLRSSANSPDPRAGQLKDFLMLLQVDSDALSTPPGMRASVQMPEEYGYGDPNEEPYRPNGVLCAAMDVSRMASSPITPEPFDGGICCKSDGSGGYRICGEGDVPGLNCDSTLDLFLEGCTLCNMERDCSDCPMPFEVIRPTPLDVDTDGDGEEDAYSIVVGVEGKRVRVMGVDPE